MVFSAVAASLGPRWAVGPEKVDRGEVATSTDITLAGPGSRQGVRLGIGFNRRDLILRAQPVRTPEPD